MNEQDLEKMAVEFYALSVELDEARQRAQAIEQRQTDLLTGHMLTINSPEYRAWGRFYSSWVNHRKGGANE